MTHGTTPNDQPLTRDQMAARLRRLPRTIRLRERLPMWGLRLVFGLLLLAFSEVVVWQNPAAHQLYEWPLLLILYTAAGSIMLDLTARYQVYTPAALGLVAGIYGLISACLITPTAFDNMPIGLLVHGMGLQTGAGFLALMLFVVVMRGKPPEPLQIGAAALVGIAFGVWVHWYPLQKDVLWGLVDLPTAQQHLTLALIVAGALFYVIVPRFGTLRETQFALYWWEMIAAFVPLFIALMVGMLTNKIPFIPLLFPLVVGAFCFWALRFQQPEVEPSILGRITFAAPNIITYVVLAIVVIVAGTFSYSLVADKDSPVGVALYFIVLGFGSAWLPFACGLIFWDVLRTEYRPREPKK